MYSSEYKKTWETIAVEVRRSATLKTLFCQPWRFPLIRWRVVASDTTRTGLRQFEGNGWLLLACRGESEAPSKKRKKKGVALVAVHMGYE